MSGTLLAFVITLLLSSVIGVVTVKKTASKRSWLDEIESRRSIDRAEEYVQSQGKGNRSRPSV